MRKSISLFIFFIVLFANTFSHAVTIQFTAVEDSYISETNPNSNFGTETVLLADGNDGSGGEIAALIKWDLSSIPPDATVTSASIILNLTDASSGPYNIIRQSTNWSEDTVDWSDLSGSATIRGIIPAFAQGQTTINLTVDGVNLVQGWVDGGFANNGVTIRTAGTTNGIDMDSRESGGFSPILEVTHSGGTPTLESLQARIADLEALLAGVVRNGNDLHFTGMNVRIESGSGATNGDTGSGGRIVNGLGNLIVGYDEPNPLFPPNKTGSHNLIVGSGHNYTSYGGFAAGENNQLLNIYASACGGHRHTVEGRWGSVTGGWFNTASGDSSTVSGGHFNEASGTHSIVSGGQQNTASGLSSSVSGGWSNQATAFASSISGGLEGIASGFYSSVTGGEENTASGSRSTVSGGLNRSSVGLYDWRAGGLFETQ